MNVAEATLLRKHEKKVVHDTPSQHPLPIPSAVGRRGSGAGPEGDRRGTLPDVHYQLFRIILNCYILGMSGLCGLFRNGFCYFFHASMSMSI